MRNRGPRLPPRTAGVRVRESKADAPTELPPFEVIEQRSPGGILLICDHATNRIPPAYGDLGVAPEALTSHVAWDIGAGDLTRRLAALLGAEAALRRDLAIGDRLQPAARPRDIGPRTLSRL